jgi:ribosomal protein L11 methyltransferase
LAIAAAKLGYAPVRAFDQDAVAVRVAKANARKNRVDQRLAIVRQDLTRTPLRGRFQYDLVCANLVDDLLAAQVDRIVNRMRRGGKLVLAGILANQFPEVQKVYERAGLRLESSHVEGGWESGAFAFRDA